jgi:hypothetical protein
VIVTGVPTKAYQFPAEWIQSHLTVATSRLSKMLTKKNLVENPGCRLRSYGRKGDGCHVRAHSLWLTTLLPNIESSIDAPVAMDMIW